MSYSMGQQLQLHQSMVLTLLTDDGLQGVAGTTVFGSPTSLAHAITDVVVPLLIGNDPLERGRLWESFDHLEKLFVSPQAFAVADCALWDLIGKQLGQPVYHLLGGSGAGLMPYASLMPYPQLEIYLEAIEAAMRAGFSAFKLHLTGMLHYDVRLCRAARALVGECTLMADASGHFDLVDALKMGRVLETLGFEWFEMPMEDRFLGGYVDLAADLDVATTSGEMSAGAAYLSAQAIGSAAWDMVRLNATNSGGITGAVQACHTAHSFGLRCDVHTWGFVVSQMPNLHVADAMPNSRYFKMPFPIGMFDYGFDGIVMDSDGKVCPRASPGLGFQFDEELLLSATTLTLS